MFFGRKETETRKSALAAPRLTLETLEERALLSVSLRGGILTLIGSPRADTFVVSLNAPAADRIEVSQNGRIRSFNRAEITSISANGLGGKDLIELDQGNGQILVPSTLLGGRGNDTLIGGGGTDCMKGQEGHDLLRGQAGDDTLEGGLGHDDADGGNGNDMVQGNEGDDHLEGGAGDDTVDGGNGNDEADGEQGDDIVNGNEGDDTLEGEEGTDKITGGPGDDLFELEDDDAGEIQDKGVGTDSIELSSFDEAPQAVENAANALIGDGKLTLLTREFSGAEATYEVEYELDGLAHSAVLSENGDLLQEELEVDPISLPVAVTDALELRFRNGVIEGAELSATGAESVFEIDLIADNQRHELTVTPAGVIQADEAQSLRSRRAEPTKFRDYSTTGVTTLFHLIPGATFTYEGVDDGDQVLLVITVLDAVKMIDGVETRIVEERESKNGELVEVSRNFFTIDEPTGNLYYFGEDVDDYEDGEIVSHGGAWRSGVHRAMFVLLVPGSPRVGMVFLQERAPGVALDTVEIVSTTQTVITPAGTFTGCVQFRETTPLEPGAESIKFWAPGIGLVQDGPLKLTAFNIP